MSKTLGPGGECGSARPPCYHDIYRDIGNTRIEESGDASAPTVGRGANAYRPEEAAGFVTGGGDRFGRPCAERLAQ
jgi:hypothetical protein